MNVGMIFIILMAICAATLGMIFIAANANTTGHVDSFNRSNSVSSNITEGNVTSLMPVGINMGSYIGIIVAFIAVLVVIGALVALMMKGGGGHASYRR